FFVLNDPAPPELYTLSLHDALPIFTAAAPTLFPELDLVVDQAVNCRNFYVHGSASAIDYSTNFDQVQFFTDTLEFVFGISDLLRSEEHTSELQSRENLVCRLLLEKK